MQQGVQRVNSESDASIATTAEGTARREKTDSNAVKTESDWTELPGSVAEQRNSTRKLEITVPARSPISTSEEENVFAKHVTMRPTRTKSITVGSGDGCHAESELCPQKYALLRRDFEGSEHSKDEHSRHASAIGWVRPSPQNSAKVTISQKEDGDSETFKEEPPKTSKAVNTKPFFQLVRQTNLQAPYNFQRKSRAPKGILLNETRKRAKQDRRKRRDAHVRFHLSKRKNIELFHLLNSDSNFVARWQMVMVLMMTYEVWAFPYRLALVDKTNVRGILIADVLVDLNFLFDMGLQLLTKVPAGTYPMQDEELTHLRDISSAYLRYTFPFEILPSFLYYFATAAIFFQCEDGLCWGWWAACIPRMVPRARRLGAYFRRMEKNLKVSVRALQGVRFSLIVFLSAHWVGCIFFWLARLNHFRDTTWVAEFEERMPNFVRAQAPFGTLYTISLYRGFNALANIGYDLVLPQTKEEILFSIVVMGLQVYMSALVLGTLLNYLVAKDRLVEAHEKQMEQIGKFAEAKGIPPELRDKIFTHLQFQHEKNMQDKASVSVKLPKSLELKVADAKYRVVISKCSAYGCPFFQCDPIFLNALLVKLRILHVMPGEEFVSKFDKPRELYFVLHGTVHVIDDDNRVKRAIRSDVPDMAPICGEVPFFLGLSHQSRLRAKANEDLKLLILDLQDSEHLSLAYPEEYQVIHENILQSQGLDSDGNELEGAVEHNDGDGTRALMKESIVKSLRRRSQERFATLIFAANSGDIETVTMLARQGVSLGEADHDGRTLLHMACATGNYKLAETVIDLGADKNLKDRWGCTPMQEAISNKQATIVQLLCQHKAILDAVDPAGEMCEAASVGDVEAVRRFVENGVDPCVGDYDLRTALHIAAAEGQVKVAEYLLGKQADPNPKDRWGSTPLMDAVRGWHLALASLLRAKGGELPQGMGAELVCTAAAAGDVRALRMLHECGEGVEVGDYDARCPLHLAAAEGRVLAVSYLLGLSASPNCSDRWGGTPLDDALAGGTLYHLYCAKLIAGWGGRVGRTADAEEALKAIADIDMEDVRTLIKKLITAGYDNSDKGRLTQREVAVAMDATVRHMPVVTELFARVDGIKGRLQENVAACDVLAESLKLSVKNIAMGLQTGKKGAVNKLRRRQSLASVSPGSPMSNTKSGLEQPNIVIQTMLMLDSLDTEAGLDLIGREGIDSDEELALYNEIDLMEQAQERALEAGLSAEKLASKDFQQLALRIVDIGDMFRMLCKMAETTTLDEDEAPLLQEEPWLSLPDVGELLELLGVDSVQPAEVEDILEEAHAFHTLHAGSRVPPPENPDRVRKCNDGGKRPSSPILKTLRASRSARKLALGGGGSPTAQSFKLRSVQAADQSFNLRSMQAGADGQVPIAQSAEPMLEQDSMRLPITSVLAGSPRFRRMISTLRVDTDLCSLLDTKLSQYLSEAELQQLLPCKVSKFEEGAVLLDTSAEAPRYLYVLNKGECSITSKDINLLGSTIHEGEMFGAYAIVIGQRKASTFEVKTTTSGEVLMIPLGQLMKILGGNHVVCDALAKVMGEAPDGDSQEESRLVGRRRPPMEDSASGNMNRWATLLDRMREHESAEATHASELEKRALKNFVVEMDQLWANVSLGSNSVFRKQLYLMEKMLGEASSELFRSMFLTKPLPAAISREVFWKTCIDFLAEELFGNSETSGESADKDEIFNDIAEKQTIEAAPSSQPQDDDPEEEPTGFLEWCSDKINSQPLPYFHLDFLDLYKDAWLDVVRDTENPLPRDKVPLLLGRVFLDFPSITKRHAQAFLVGLGKDKDTKVLYWHEVHKVLCDKRMGINQVYHGPMIGTALNPTWSLLQRWRAVLRLCAVYYLVMVPARIALLPWDNFMDPGALCSDLVVDVLVTVDLIIRLNTAHRSSKATWTTRRWKILRKVPVAAIIAGLPIDWFGYACGAGNERACWLRIPKVLLILSLVKGRKTSISPKVETLQNIFRLVTLLLHWTCCCWFYLGRSYSQWSPSDHVSWTQVDPDIAHLTFDREEIFGLDGHATVWDKYLMSLYWVTATLTANGSVGVLLPQNLIEIIFTILLLILNLTVVNAILGEVSSMIMSADKETVNEREHLETVDSFISGNNLSRDLQTEIRRHFSSMDNGTAMDQSEVLSLLSNSLQLQIAGFTSREFLEGVEVLQGISDYLRDSLCVLLREATFPPGQWLFYEAENPNEMYFLTSGAVEECSANETGQVGTENLLRTPSSVGELAFFFGVRHYFSARAGKNGATCLVMERTKFLSLLKLFPDEAALISQNALRIMDKVQATRPASSKGSRVSRGARSARSTFSGRSATSSAHAGGDAGKSSEHQGSVSSGQSKGSEMNSDIFEHAEGNKKRKDKISTLKAKRKYEVLLAFLRDCKSGDLEAVKKSLEDDIQISSTDATTKRSGLHVAACEGHEELVKFLLEQKADPGLKDGKGNTVLNDAVRHRQDATCAVLREAFPDQGVVYGGKTAGVLMCHAAYSGDLNHIQRLLDNGCGTHEADYDGRTALHLSSCEGHVQVVKFLLEKRASVACVDRFGGTPMEDAVRHGHVEVQALLRGSGARLEMSGKDYSTKLCEAAANGDLESIQVLAKNGVDIQAADYDGRTALHLAAANENVGVLEFLLRFEPRINFNPLDRFQDTPLGDATRHHRPTAISMLKQAGGLQKGDPLLIMAAMKDSRNEERKKTLREPAVLELMSSSMEKTALKWVIEKLEPTMNDKTEGMLAVIQTLSTALEELATLLGLAAATIEPRTPGLWRDALPEGSPFGAASAASPMGLSARGGSSPNAFSNAGSPMLQLARHGEKLVRSDSEDSDTPRDELIGCLWKKSWEDRHEILKERAEEVVELSQSVKRMVLDGLSVFGGQASEAPMDCKIWRMASRKYQEQSNRWQHLLKVVSGLCLLSRKLARDIVRRENRKARALGRRISEQ